VAVIGAGVAGLTAAYLLQRRYDVTLFEAAERLGGHAHTHDVVTADAGTLPVDTGFIVYNESTYPQLRRLLAELRVETQPTDMSMSIRCEGCGLEYAGGRGLGGVLAQPRQAGNPAFIRLLLEVGRFHRLAKALMVEQDDQVTLEGFLARHAFSPYFVRHFVVPVVSCVWSAGTGVALQYPARYLFIFLENHGMLSVSGSPTWRTIVGGSRTYVEGIAKSVHAVLSATPVRSLTRVEGGVELRDDCDEMATFDGAVVATHADEALRLLARPTEAERAVLGAFSYSRNATWLHTDASLLPRARRARSSWNYLLSHCDADLGAVLVSYDMNRLQALPSRHTHLVTLNAAERIDERRVIDRMVYEHPIYTVDSVAAQERLPELNDGTVAFAGAYHGWGFHEDGCRSGVAAAASLGVTW
jgi:uncharacterized protein